MVTKIIKMLNFISNVEKSINRYFEGELCFFKNALIQILSTSPAFTHSTIKNLNIFHCTDSTAR